MKPGTPIVLVSLLCCTIARAQVAPVSEAAQEHLKAEFHFDPNLARDEPETPVGFAADVVELPAMTVTESIRRRDLEQAVEKSEREWKERQYSIIWGGTIYTKEFRHAKLELGTWSAAGGIGFLKLSW